MYGRGTGTICLYPQTRFGTTGFCRVYYFVPGKWLNEIWRELIFETNLRVPESLLNPPTVRDYRQVHFLGYCITRNKHVYIVKYHTNHYKWVFSEYIHKLIFNEIDVLILKNEYKQNLFGSRRYKLRRHTKTISHKHVFGTFFSKMFE